MRIYIDTDTGQLKAAADGSPLGPLTFYAGDILHMEVVYLKGNEPITSTVLADNAVQKLGIKSRPGASQILVLATSYTLQDQVAVSTFSLNTAQLKSYIDNSVSPIAPTFAAVFEVEVSTVDGSQRTTYHQSACTLRREVNSIEDNAPDVEVDLYILKAAMFDNNGRAINGFYVGYRNEIDALTGGTVTCLDGISTVQLPVPVCFLIRLPGAGGQMWVLESDGTTPADGQWVVDPVDFNPDTPRKWKRFL